MKKIYLFVETILHKVFFSYFSKINNYIVQMMTLTSEAHIESFPKVSHHSTAYRGTPEVSSWMAFFSSSWAGSWMVFKNFSFKKMSQGLKSGERVDHATSSRKEIRRPWNVSYLDNKTTLNLTMVTTENLIDYPN